MTLKECYQNLEGDYEGVTGRLHGERLAQKFVLKFLEDKSYEALCAAMEEGVQQEAFRAAHTIKGMCQNLSFTRLERSSSELTEALRGGDMAAAEKLLPNLQQDYERTVNAIRDFAAGIE